MATKTSLQAGIPPIFSPETQDHSVSDDEILDNFAEGPDDGMPLGVGGEKGKQAEPASSTLEADILRGTPKQPGEEVPPDSASEAPPVQEPAGETGPETIPEPSDSDEPEIPPMLLQMAGYADADAAKADGLGTPEALNAFIRGRGQLLSSQPGAAPSGQVQPYLRAEQPPQAPAPAPAPSPEAETPGEFRPFELTEEDTNILDDQLQDTIRRMNEHNQRQFQAQEQRIQSLQASMSERETNAAARQAEEEVVQFDQAVQNLGDGWQDLFGEGDASELAVKAQTDPASRLALEYRRELFETVQTIRDVNSQRGFESMDLNREIGFGLQQRFPDKFQQTVSANPSTPRRTSLNRPTQRRSPPTKQDKLLERLEKQHPGVGFTATGEDEFEGEI